LLYKHLTSSAWHGSPSLFKGAHRDILIPPGCWVHLQHLFLHWYASKHISSSSFKYKYTVLYKNTRLIFVQNLRTIPTSAEELSLKFSIKVVNKTAASAAQLAKCILLHAYSCTNAVPRCTTKNKNFI